MLDDLDDRCVPILTRAIIKNAIAADHQIISIAIGKCRRDDHFFISAAAPALAVGQVCAAQVGHAAVLIQIRHPQAATAIEIKRSRLEYRFITPGIEVTE